MTTTNNQEPQQVVKAKYLFCMNSGDLFEGNLNVRFKANEELDNDLWNVWWGEKGNEFIESCALNAVDTLGITPYEDFSPVSFVLLAPLEDNNGLNKIVQVASHPSSWPDTVVTAWETLVEAIDLPNMETIEAQFIADFGLRLVSDNDDDTFI